MDLFALSALLVSVSILSGMFWMIARMPEGARQK
jgi:hypothetical protein